MPELTSMIEEYAPKILAHLSETDMQDRAITAANTVRWWIAAHEQQSRYHQDFRGYCPQCKES